MRQLYTLAKQILLINLRNRTTLFWNFAFPIGLIVLYGVIWGGERFGPVAAIAWLTVGVVVLNIMSSGFLGDAAWLTTMRDRGILLRIQATPLPEGRLVVAYVVVRLLLVLLQAVAITLVSILVFGASFTWSGLALACGLAILGAVAFIAMGQAIAAVAPNAGAAMAIGQALYFPLMFVSNLFLPADGLPAWLVQISRYTPAYMLVDLIRPALVPVAASQAVWLNLAGLLLYGALGLVVAARFFRWAPRR